MAKLSILAATALLVLSLMPLTAQAQSLRGNTLQNAAQNFTPIKPAACRGWGPRCGPGFIWRWGRCRPCF